MKQTFPMKQKRVFFLIDRFMRRDLSQEGSLCLFNNNENYIKGSANALTK